MNDYSHTTLLKIALFALFFALSSHIFSQITKVSIETANDKIEPFVLQLRVLDPVGQYSSSDISVGDTIVQLTEGKPYTLVDWLVTGIYKVSGDIATIILNNISATSTPRLGDAILIKNGAVYRYCPGISDIEQYLLSKRLNSAVLNAVVNDVNYIHYQNTADTVWRVGHHLNKWPAINVYDSEGRMVIYGSIQFINNDSLHILFDIPTSGYVILN